VIESMQGNVKKRYWVMAMFGLDSYGSRDKEVTEESES